MLLCSKALDSASELLSTDFFPMLKVLAMEFSDVYPL